MRNREHQGICFLPSYLMHDYQLSNENNQYKLDVFKSQSPQMGNHDSSIIYAQNIHSK